MHARTLILLVLILTPAIAAIPPQEGNAKESIAPAQFVELHKLIRVQPGEQRFWQIDWRLNIAQARREAARSGRPILVWSGAGGAPIGVC